MLGASGLRTQDDLARVVGSCENQNKQLLPDNLPPQVKAKLMTHARSLAVLAAGKQRCLQQVAHAALVARPTLVS